MSLRRAYRQFRDFTPKPKAKKGLAFRSILGSMVKVGKTHEKYLHATKGWRYRRA